jgi:hypothetical protein
MEFMNELLIELDHEPVDDQAIFEKVFAKMWENIVHLDQLDADFDQNLASVFLSIKTDADVNQLTKDIATLVENPFKSHKLDVENGKLYLDSIPDQESWNVLYKKFINIIPFTPMGKLAFGGMNEHFYKMYKKCDDKEKLKEIVVDYYTNELLPLLLTNASKVSQAEEQQIV